MSTPSDSMKTLIDDLITIIRTAITAGEVSAKSVHKGISDDPAEVPVKQWPFIAVDDGGERIDESDSETTQNRIYTVRIQVNCHNMKHETCLDNVLDLFNELKVVLEKNANRLMDDYKWAVSSVPFDWDKEENGFFRGREILVEWGQIEFREAQY